VLTAARCLLPLLALCLWPTPCTRAASAAFAGKEAALLAAKYGIKIVFAERPTRAYLDRLRAEPATAEQIRKYFPLLRSEFGLYPTEFVKKSKLKQLVLCTHLSFDRQPRAAIPHFEENTLYLDVERGSRQPNYQRAVLHHEYFHIVDYQDDGLLYEDRSWKELNPPGFHYGRGGKQVQDDPTVSVLTDSYPGFLNRYAMAGVEEDKAEVFTYLILRPQLMKERGERDAVLLAKQVEMKRLLRNFCPQVNDSFWQKVQDRSRPNDG
jgi:hypothetical protein